MKNKITQVLLVLFLLFPFILFSQNIGSLARININKINLPFNNSGVLAEILVPDGGKSNGYFEEHEFLFSGGFYLSGFVNDSLWASLVAPASLVEDYLPGTVGMDPNDPKASIYLVRSNDIPFGQSWQDWKDAVDLGADFYDGDNDGVYNPVDLNYNNTWDEFEDKPNLVGDEMYWCVYNDGVPANQRRWENFSPVGVEIRQSIFAYESANALGNVVFIRYKIKNTGLVTDTIKDVYFSNWADPDIGEVDGFHENLAGVDTLRNAGYTYLNTTSPNDWGDNPPCFMIDLLSGPLSYIPGISFSDVNGNNVYDEGLDISLDTAFSYRGELGVNTYPGAKNLDLTSSIFYLWGNPNFYNSSSVLGVRRSMLGLRSDGEVLDPCTWPYATVNGGIDCSQVNPIYWCSGDPATNIGWISAVPGDLGSLQSTGPFELVKDKEVEIFVAYIVGRGNTALNSVTVAGNISDEVQSFVESNFGYPDEKNPEIFNPEFTLYQNYPNPFNPNTTIRYAVPLNKSKQTMLVQLKIFDVLGREITTLLDEEKPVGMYKVTFNGSELPSGIYFYKLQIGEYTQTKKMVLLK